MLWPTPLRAPGCNSGENYPHSGLCYAMALQGDLLLVTATTSLSQPPGLYCLPWWESSHIRFCPLLLPSGHCHQKPQWCEIPILVHAQELLRVIWTGQSEQSLAVLCICGLCCEDSKSSVTWCWDTGVTRKHLYLHGWCVLLTVDKNLMWHVRGASTLATPSLSFHVVRAWLLTR